MSNEHNNAPAVPQGFEPAGYLLHWPSFGGSRKVIWNESRVSGDAIGCPVTPVFKQSAATPAPTPAQEQCNACLGTGRMVRDPDIGTDQECFVCDGAGYEPAQEAGLTDAWTSVSDKLPSDLGLKFVEFYSDDLRNPTNQVIGLYEDGVWWSGGIQFCNVTHWKPLTPAPIAALRAKGGK
jgi:hypothetical protein